MNTGKRVLKKDSKMKSLERFPNVTFPKIFNKLNDNIRNCTSFKSTKAKMKKSILNCYSSFKWLKENVILVKNEQYWSN